MRRYVFTLIVSVFTLGIFAQSHSNRLSLGVGALYERGVDVTLSWDHETKYHNAWEYFVNGYVKWDKCDDCGHVCTQSFWKNYRTWSVGAAYKPCVARGKNNYGNIRIGASAGSNTDDFIGGIHVGYEHNYCLRGGWQLYMLVKCDAMIPNREDLFREGAQIGVRCPL